jgi:hypothetical protein
MKYRIVEGIYNNEYGEEKHKIFYIEIQRSFLGIKYWSSVKHKECGWGDVYNTRTEFKTHSEAHDFILNVHCGNENRDGWKYKVVSQFDCSMDKNVSDTNKNNIS